MNILISGGTGFIGKHVTNKLIKEKHNVYILTRSSHKRKNTTYKTYIDYNYPVEKLPKIDAIINLAGESLFGLWTKKKKETILTSRIKITEKIIDMISKMNKKPNVFISGSAVGFYGMYEDIIYTENTTTPGDDFLAKVTSKWEQVAKNAEQFGVRTVYTRFGVVLAKTGGAFPLMALPVKMFVGGKIGNGKQWLSWIHIDDCVNMLLFALNNDAISGPFNITAPNPIRQKQFIKTIGKKVNRPTIIPTPKFIIKLALGEMSTLITEGQYVYPEKALHHGFSFNYPSLHDALNDTFKK